MPHKFRRCLSIQLRYVICYQILNLYLFKITNHQNHRTLQMFVNIAKCLSLLLVGCPSRKRMPKTTSCKSKFPTPKNIPLRSHLDPNSKNVSLLINEAYDNIVHWRTNLFPIPKGSLGKEFIKEMTSQLDKWTNHTTSRGYSLKSLMILPNLLLQKSSHTKNAKHQNKANRG